MTTIHANDFRKLQRGKKSKYRNKKVRFDGMVFDSMKEYRRWIDLNILEENHHIFDLERQVVFDLGVCKYKADFVYNVQVRYGIVTTYKQVVEDVKGFKTAMYKLKKKMMLKVHGITIKET